MEVSTRHGPLDFIVPSLFIDSEMKLFDCETFIMQYNWCFITLVYIMVLYVMIKTAWA